MSSQLRALPSVEVLAASVRDADRFPRRIVVEEARRVIDSARNRILQGGKAPGDLPAELARALDLLCQPSLRRVINATGVVLHTNLGRAPLPRPIEHGFYSNLEYDLDTGRRGKRDSHFAPLLERLLGCPGIAVNNGAAAVWLVLREFASGAEVIVSRGELIEIGDGFRIPDIMAQSGARLVEVGTTNRTRMEDYRAAITANTRLILRVHPSNFRMVGFTGAPAIEELAALAAEREIPLYEDLGSGNLWDFAEWGITEPTVAASLKAGAAIVSFSGDKLLGGPQAGLIAGHAGLVERVRRNPMYRALRLDKLAIAALETTLRAILLERWDLLPALAMIRQPLDALHTRAARLASAVGGEVLPGESLIGGGSTPAQTLASWLVALPGNAPGVESRLRRGTPPVIARIENQQLLLDLRTVAPEEDGALLKAVGAALASSIQARS